MLPMKLVTLHLVTASRTLGQRTLSAGLQEKSEGVPELVIQDQTVSPAALPQLWA
jgi:hypothetical protein